ncbi:hypothetical protein WDU94_000493, partial [Cyamophila willieti]
VNGIVLHGRCHLNASAIIKGLAGPLFKLILHRRQTGIEDLAVKPITQFPVTLDDETPEEKYANFKGLRTVAIKKPGAVNLDTCIVANSPTQQAQGQGLGIMIIEGKHAEVGKGIFISDIQEGSAAEQAGLIVGDMILAVNKDAILGTSYDSAASILKKCEGIVTLVVCNPNLKEGGGTEGAAAKDKPKEEKPKEEKKLNVTFSDQHLPPTSQSSHPTQSQPTHPQFNSTTSSTPTLLSTSNATSHSSRLADKTLPTAPLTTHPVAGTASHARQLATHQPQRTHYPRAKPGATGASSGALTSSVKHKEPEEPPPDPATAQIVSGKEVIIEILDPP